MKLATFSIDGKQTYGAVSDDGVVDLGRRFGTRFPDLKALLAASAQSRSQRKDSAITYANKESQ
jgi:hypothetical protein